MSALNPIHGHLQPNIPDEADAHPVNTNNVASSSSGESYYSLPTGESYYSIPSSESYYSIPSGESYYSIPYRSTSSSEDGYFTPIMDGALTARNSSSNESYFTPVTDDVVIPRNGRVQQPYVAASQSRRFGRSVTTSRNLRGNRRISPSVTFEQWLAERLVEPRSEENIGHHLDSQSTAEDVSGTGGSKVVYGPTYMFSTLRQHMVPQTSASLTSEPSKMNVIQHLGQQAENIVKNSSSAYSGEMPNTSTTYPESSSSSNKKSRLISQQRDNTSDFESLKYERGNTSPSGISLCSAISAMEWDPSADVGTTTHHSPGEITSNNTKHRDITKNFENFHLSDNTTKSTYRAGYRMAKSLSDDCSFQPQEANVDKRELSVSLSDLVDPGIKLNSIGTQELHRQQTTSNVMARDTKHDRNSNTRSAEIYAADYENGVEASQYFKDRTSHGNENFGSLNIDEEDNETLFPPTSHLLNNTNRNGEMDTKTDWSSRSCDVNSISSWLNSGLTRSEIDYQKRNKSSESDSGNLDSLSVSITCQPLNGSQVRRVAIHDAIQQINQSVQTEQPILREISSNTKRRPPSSLTERRTRKTNQSTQTKDSHCSNVCQRSDRQPSNRKTHLPSNRSTSSDLTPTCSFINKCVRNNSGIGQENIVNAIIKHRHVHIENVRADLERIISLNRKLCEIRSSPPVPPSSSNEVVASGSITNSTSVESSDVQVSSDSKRSKECSPTNLSPGLNSNRTPPKCKCGGSSSKIPLPKFSAEFKEMASCRRLDKIVNAFEAFIGTLAPETTGSVPVNLPLVDVATNRARIEITQRPVTYFLPFAGTRDPISTVGVVEGQATKSSLNTKKNKVPEKFNSANNGVTKGISTLNLQEALARNCLGFIKRSNARANIIAKSKTERIRRAVLKREWVRCHGTKYLSDLEEAMPAKGPRLMSSQEIREATRRRCKRLPEVQELKLKLKLEEEKATNRLMSTYFAGVRGPCTDEAKIFRAKGFHHIPIL